MRAALDEAERAAERGEAPIGAALVREGEVVAAAGNRREERSDPTAHAEVLAIRAAARALGGWRLSDSTLYVTLEPCSMCAGAIILARVPRRRFRRPRPEGGRGWKRPRRARRAPPQPPPGRDRRADGRRVGRPAGGVLQGPPLAEPLGSGLARL